MQLASWSQVKMYSQGVFDVWFVCPHCGYESWARAYGVGEGHDAGIKKTASAVHAQFQADLMAEHAAARAVHGSPCPRCAQHHPDIVRWAAVADRQERQRLLTRQAARVLRVLGVVCLAFVVLLGLMHEIADALFLMFLAGCMLGVGRLLMVATPSTANRWRIYPRTAPGVTFLTPGSP